MALGQAIAGQRGDRHLVLMNSIKTLLWTNTVVRNGFWDGSLRDSHRIAVVPAAYAIVAGWASARLFFAAHADRWG